MRAGWALAAVAVVGLAGVIIAAQAGSAGPTPRAADAGAQDTATPAAGPLILPIACDPGRTCEIQNHVDRDPGAGAHDYRCGSRTYDGHAGVDFRIPDLAALQRGVAVLAAADGVVLRVRDGVQDVSVRTGGPVDGRECGNGVVVSHADGLTTQYCHLQNGSIAVRQGQAVTAGQPVGRVGLSGQTEYPHLHFTVRRNGAVVDPFAPQPAAAGTCGAGAALWRPETAARLPYRDRVVLNAGFAAEPLTMEAVEAGAVAAPSRDGAALIAYVRALGLKAGDVQRLSIVGPDGRQVVETTAEPLARDQAQRLLFAGRRRPPQGWGAGRYEAVYEVLDAGRVVLTHRFEATL